MKPREKRKPMEEKKKIIIINVLREKRYYLGNKTRDYREKTLKKIRKLSRNQQSKDSVEEIFKNIS